MPPGGVCGHGCLIGRRYRSAGDYRRALNIEELRAIARRRLPAFAFEYIEGGAEDEATLRRNREVFAGLCFVPRQLVDVSGRHLRTSLFGREIASPLLIAPTGINGMIVRDADAALARAATRHGIPFTLSTLSTTRIERVAEIPGVRLWMQLYVLNRREITAKLLARAEAAGCEALVLTVDTNVFGAREWDARNYRGPARLRFANLLDAALHPRWLWRTFVPDGIPRFENVAEFVPPEARTATGGVTVVPKLLSGDLSWREVEWLRAHWPHRLLLKGILHVDDARRALELGCDGLVIGNHGGRQLDCCVSPIDVLPAIAAAVGDRLTLIAESGFRRGSDVLKALALGARAVMLGRATLYGLAAGGEAGVDRALTIVEGEMLRTLGLLGCCSVEELGPHVLTKPADP